MIGRILELFGFSKNRPEKVRLLIRNNKVVLSYIPKEIAINHFKMCYIQQQITCYEAKINKARVIRKGRSERIRKEGFLKANRIPFKWNIEHSKKALRE